MTTGKDGFTGVAGSRICNKGPIREWVRIRSNVPDRSGNGSVQPTGPKEISGVAVQATTVKTTGVVVGPISDKSQSTSDREGSALPKPPMSILGLGDDDFPPIRPMSDLGATIKASKLVFESKKKMDGPKVNASLISANTRPQPVRIGSKFDNKFDGRGNGATAAVLHSDDHKVSHKWRSLFANRPKSCSPLAYYNPSTLDGKVTINPPPEAVVEGVGIWEGSLVGQFLDKRLPLHVVKSFVGRLWGKHKIPEISTTDNGLYIFRFKDLDARDCVLENGAWYFAGRPIILRFWKPGMEMLNVQITSLPIWVKFFNIPLEYWTVTSLGYIASAVGIPLHLDTLTENHSRLSFARICIEVNVNCTFPKSALLDLGNGKYSTIRIEYPWVPQNCTHCKIFGHSHVKRQGMKEMVDSKTNRLNHVDRRPDKDITVDVDSSPVGMLLLLLRI